MRFRKKDTGDEISTEQRVKPAKKVYPAKTFVQVIDRGNIDYYPCQVHDDHRITWRQGREQKSAEVKFTPSVLTLPSSVIPVRVARWLAPKNIRAIVYSVKRGGEFTHDPSITGFTEEQEIRVEQIIKLTAAAAKANLAAKMMEGLKDHDKWELFGWLILVGLIVFMFLFAFQVAPYM